MTASQRPTRATVEGRAYLDLQNLARRQQRPNDELQQLYVLEGFLARLTESADAQRLVLKGGVLLAAYDARRPTRDIDLQASAISGERDDVLQLVRTIAAVDLDDGLIFDTGAATAETIRDDDEYAGVRVIMTATLATAQLSLHVDVNIGDPIWPAPQTVELPRLLGGTITLAGYPLSMVYGEKIITALQRGTINTRWRDFADIYVLTGHHPNPGSRTARRAGRGRPIVRSNRHLSARLSPDTPPSPSRAGLCGDANNTSTTGSRLRSATCSNNSSPSPIPLSTNASTRPTGIHRQDHGSCRTLRSDVT